MTKAGRGGKRPNSGRKKAIVKKVPVFIYPLGSEVDALGGKGEVKRLAEAAISKQAKKCG